MASFDKFNPTCEDCLFYRPDVPLLVTQFGWCHKILNKQKRVAAFNPICNDALPKED